MFVCGFDAQITGRFRTFNDRIGIFNRSKIKGISGFGLRINRALPTIDKILRRNRIAIAPLSIAQRDVIGQPILTGRHFLRQGQLRLLAFIR